MASHTIILNRWSDSYAEYGNYIDHTKNTVTYIVTSAGRKGVPDGAADCVIVDDLDDYESVLPVAQHFADKFGIPDSVVALYEDDTIVGAMLREHYRCNGPKVADVRPFRDKLMQLDLATRRGVRTPRYRSVSRTSEVSSFAAEVGFPVIVKPTMASSCIGISMIRSADEIHTIQFDPRFQYLAQEYIDLPIYHVDGLFKDGILVRAGVSKYISNCLEFQSGGSLGSLEIDDTVLRRDIEIFAESALKAMWPSDEALIFHMEVFVDEETCPSEACIFLEVGARVGGGGIPFAWRELYGFDLMRMQFELSVGRTLEGATGCERHHDRAGWLLIQLPISRPCEIESVTSLLGSIDGLYAEAIPEEGTIVPLTNTYFEHVAGRFRFKGRDYLELYQIMTEAVNSFEVKARSLV